MAPWPARRRGLGDRGARWRPGGLPPHGSSTPRSGRTEGSFRNGMESPSHWSRAPTAGQQAHQAGEPKAPRAHCRLFVADHGVEIAQTQASGRGWGRPPSEDCSGVLLHVVTQSRMASLVASLRVAVPAVTGCTLAPSTAQCGIMGGALRGLAAHVLCSAPCRTQEFARSELQTVVCSGRRGWPALVSAMNSASCP